MSTLRDMNASTAAEATQVDALREAMIAELRELEAIRCERVAEAFRAVPRHLFAPGEPLEAVYAADSALVTKRDEHGAAVSLVSSAHIQATMLEQAQLGVGMRVLEIGSGGYNAALIAELVGESGKVVSVDIDPDIVDRTRDCLAAAGYSQVDVVLADAEDGVPDHAPYDRVIVTVGAWDIPPAWSDPVDDRRAGRKPPGQPRLSAVWVRADAGHWCPQRAGGRARRGQSQPADRRGAAC
ncbi:MAG: methyltransferase domain-containing protein [Pseudonocardiaceae bacterium]